MDKRRITVIAVAGAILLVAAVLGILYFSFLSRSTAKVVLPDTEHTGGQNSSGEGEYGGEIVDVTAETVPNIVAVLERPENYHLQVRVTVWSRGAATTVTGNLWVMDSMSCAAIGQPDSTIKNTVTAGGKVYIWYSDAPDRLFEGAAGNFGADDAMMMYTYEDIISADRACITGAGYEKLNGTSCIYATMEKNGIETKFWVSAEDGILLRAERTVDGETIYNMETTLMEKGTVTAELFTLPDGRALSA